MSFCGFLLGNVTLPVYIDLIRPHTSIRVGIRMGISEGWGRLSPVGLFYSPDLLKSKNRDGVVDLYIFILNL